MDKDLESWQHLRQIEQSKVQTVHAHTFLYLSYKFNNLIIY